MLLFTLPAHCFQSSYQAPPSSSLCYRFHDRSWPTAPRSCQPARFTLLIHYSDTARMIFLILTLRCPVSTFPRPAHQRGEVCLSWHLTFDHPGSTRHFSSLAGTPSIMCFPEPAFPQLFPMFRLLCFNNCLLNKSSISKSWECRKPRSQVRKTGSSLVGGRENKNVDLRAL